MSRRWEDYYTSTEADAAAWARAHAERLSPLEQALEDGYDPHPEDER